MKIKQFILTVLGFKNFDKNLALAQNQFKEVKVAHQYLKAKA